MTEVSFKSEWAQEYPYPSEYTCDCGKTGASFHMFKTKKYEGYKCERCFITYFWPEHPLAIKE